MTTYKCMKCGADVTAWPPTTNFINTFCLIQHLRLQDEAKSRAVEYAAKVQREEAEFLLKQHMGEK